MNIQKGSLVRVRTYGGKVQVRRLVEVKGKTAIVTTDVEREASAKERRDPICIGFPLADVIAAVKEKPKS